MVRTFRQEGRYRMPQLPTFEQQDYENLFKKQVYLIAKLFTVSWNILLELPAFPLHPSEQLIHPLYS